MTTTRTTEPSSCPAALVTGASRGIGAAIADHLTANGWRVFAGMRHPNRSSRPLLQPVQLDVTDPTSIEAAVRLIESETGPGGLAAVINNAAIIEAGPLASADDSCVERHLRTNVAGPLAVIRATLPMLRRAGGRIVNISSINAELPLPYWGLYSASKAALQALSDSLRLELAADGIGVTVVTPGAFGTDIRRRALDAWPVELDSDARTAIAGLVAHLDATASPIEDVAVAVHEALVAEPVPARVAVGAGIEGLLELARLPVEARDEMICALLWPATGGGDTADHDVTPEVTLARS